jgi:hypothetical protein
MIGPKAEGSTGNGELVGDATGLSVGLVAGATLDDDGLARPLADVVDAAADEATGASLAPEAG